MTLGHLTPPLVGAGLSAAQRDLERLVDEYAAADGLDRRRRDRLAGLILATAMPLPFAIGTSLVVVSALGLTTALSYALSGLVDWSVTAMLVVGGVAGTIGGIALGKVLGTRKGLLERGFAAVVIAVGTYVTASSL